MNVACWMDGEVVTIVIQFEMELTQISKNYFPAVHLKNACRNKKFYNLQYWHT